MLVTIFKSQNTLVSWVKMTGGVFKSGGLCLRDLSSRQCIHFKLGTLRRTARLGSHPRQIRKRLDSSISRWDVGTKENADSESTRTAKIKFGQVDSALGKVEVDNSLECL